MSGVDSHHFKMPQARRFVRSLSRLRDLHSEMTVNQMITLFLIAENPGLTQRDLLVSLGTTDSASSRIIALLSDIGSRNVVGLALVEMKVNVQDRRERHLFLTSKGRRLMEDIGTDFEKPIR